MTPTGPHTRHSDLDEHDPLRALAHISTTPAPPVEGVHHRAAAIRRNHRRTRAGISVGVLASALVVGGIVLPQTQNGPGPTGTPQAASFIGIARAQAAEGAGSCNGGSDYGSRIERQQWSTDPRAGELASWIPAEAIGEPVRGIDVQSLELNCPPPAPAAALYTQAPTAAGLALWSDVARPFRGKQGLKNVQVRGTTAELLPLPEGDADAAAKGRGNLMLSWTEPDGTRWVVQGSGLDQAAIIATLDTLVLDGATVETASIPATWQQSPLPKDPTGREWTWTVEYGPSGYTQDPPGIRLNVTPVVEPVATQVARSAALLTFTRVHGQLATFFTDQGGCLDWDEAGLSYSVCGSMDMDVLVNLAEQVEHVSATDPRVQAAPDLFPTADSAG